MNKCQPHYQPPDKADATLNKVVSALVYRKFRTVLQTRAFKEGVEVITVNPAYTSFIGRLKYLPDRFQQSPGGSPGDCPARPGPL